MTFVYYNFKFLEKKTRGIERLSPFHGAGKWHWPGLEPGASSFRARLSLAAARL